jgi:hypothetical protein
MKLRLSILLLAAALAASPAAGQTIKSLGLQHHERPSGLQRHKSADVHKPLGGTTVGDSVFTADTNCKSMEQALIR